MTVTRILCGAAVLAVAVLSACATPAGTTTTRTTPPTTTATVAGTLPVGPGPQAVYTAQPQPPAGACRTRTDGAYPLPDPVCTPGATNPAVTQANIHSTVCTKGYTASIRPPRAVTDREKRANAAAYGGGQDFRTSELDHLIPLELGGDPNDPRNMWVEPNDIPHATKVINVKDGVESAARAAVCAGRLPLAQAQYLMATNWPQFGRQLGVITSSDREGHPYDRRLR